MYKIKSSTYQRLVNNIGASLEEGKTLAVQKINTTLVVTYWKIGQQIVEFEQDGKNRADYGTKLLTTLSRDLKKQFGKGFSKSNLYMMRLLYLKFPIFQTLSGKLSWSHYIELLSIKTENTFETATPVFLCQTVGYNYK